MISMAGNVNQLFNFDLFHVSGNDSVLLFVHPVYWVFERRILPTQQEVNAKWIYACAQQRTAIHG